MLDRRYASSFIDVAGEAGALADIEKNISVLEAVLADSSDLQSLVRSPVYGAARQMAVMTEIAKKCGFHQLTINFLSVLAEKRRLNRLSHIIQAFYREVAKRRGEVSAHVRTAHALSAEQENRLEKELAAKTGQAVRLTIEVDPALLGGMVITVGSRMIDDSLKTKLSRLEKAMTSNANSHTVSLKEVG